MTERTVKVEIRIGEDKLVAVIPAHRVEWFRRLIEPYLRIVSR